MLLVFFPTASSHHTPVQYDQHKRSGGDFPSLSIHGQCTLRAEPSSPLLLAADRNVEVPAVPMFSVHNRCTISFRPLIDPFRRAAAMPMMLVAYVSRLQRSREDGIWRSVAPISVRCNDAETSDLGLIS
jgi:hypothetical protein